MNEYDRIAEATGWHGNEVLFGLMYSRLVSGQKLLDIGIGTGMSSALFQRAGLEVTGLDRSDEMLEFCREKGVGEELIQHDLSVAPFPLPDGVFDHAVCSGVLPFLAHPEIVFQEVKRLLKPGGLLGFMVLSRSEDSPKTTLVASQADDRHGDMRIHLHAESEWRSWLEGQGIELYRRLPITLFLDGERRQPIDSLAVVAQVV